jgi:magnesium-transporting ATPase (P-type)
MTTTSSTTAAASSAIDILVDQIWKDIVASSSSSNTSTTAVSSVEEGNSLSLQAHLKSGWTTDQASQRREIDGSFNVVKPPIDCPNWLCIVLPCIHHLASMKAFQTIQPDDAEVLRNGQWIRYDAASLVTGDVLRLEEGDLIPADCVVVEIDGEENDEDDLLVDLAAVTGHERPQSIRNNNNNNNHSTIASRQQRQLYMGGRIVQGGATAIVTATGPQTLLATLIREKRFPPKEPIILLATGMDDGRTSADAGIQLRSMS